MQSVQSRMDHDVQEPQQHEAVFDHPSGFLMQQRESIFFQDFDGHETEAGVVFVSSSLSLNLLCCLKYSGWQAEYILRRKYYFRYWCGTNRSPHRHQVRSEYRNKRTIFRKFTIVYESTTPRDLGGGSLLWTWAPTMLLRPALEQEQILISATLPSRKWSNDLFCFLPWWRASLLGWIWNLAP